MIFIRHTLCLGIALACAACTATQSYSPDKAPEYVITRNFSPFYRTGPMQARGPDASLPSQTRVKVLSQEMGYSLVRLDDDRQGYVANENMEVAPPQPAVPRFSLGADDTATKKGGKKRGASGTRYRGEQVNDVPLPNAVPPPDLNIAPEEVPSSTPSLDPPATSPKFRF